MECNRIVSPRRFLFTVARGSATIKLAPIGGKSRDQIERRSSMLHAQRLRLPASIGIALPALIAGLASGADPPKYKSVRIDGVPFVRQRPDFCGEACAEMALKKLGKRLDQDFVFNQAQLD